MYFAPAFALPRKHPPPTSLLGKDAKSRIFPNMFGGACKRGPPRNAGMLHIASHRISRFFVGVVGEAVCRCVCVVKLEGIDQAATFFFFWFI